MGGEHGETLLGTWGVTGRCEKYWMVSSFMDGSSLRGSQTVGAPGNKLLGTPSPVRHGLPAFARDGAQASNSFAAGSLSSPAEPARRRALRVVCFDASRSNAPIRCRALVTTFK